MQNFFYVYAIVSTLTTWVLIGAYVHRNQLHDPVSPGAIWAFNAIAFTVAMVSVSGVTILIGRALTWVL